MSGSGTRNFGCGIPDLGIGINQYVAGRVSGLRFWVILGTGTRQVGCGYPRVPVSTLLRWMKYFLVLSFEILIYFTI